MRLRFVVKKIQTGPRSYEHRVYDQQRGSFPYRTPELGVVAQDHPTEKAAQDECDRLTQQFGYINEKAMTSKKTTRPVVDDEDD